MNRRALLAGAAAGLGIVAAGISAEPGARAGTRVCYLAPSRNSNAVFVRGRPLRDDPAFRSTLPAGWSGETTMITRIDERGEDVRRQLLPVEKGHAVALSPERSRAVLTGQNGRHICTFDPATLEVDAVATAHGPEAVAGGHALYLADGGPLLVAERRAYTVYEGAPERHFGHVTLRDPVTLQVLESYSAHGIAPHEINLLDDGHHLVIANYGTTAAADDGADEDTLPLVEPSLTMIDIRDGRLAYRWVPGEPEFEIRHIAAHRADRIFALQNRRKPFAEIQALMTRRTTAYLPDLAADGLAHAPAPVLRFDLAEAAQPRECLPDSGLGEMGRGQSIVYDPVHDEAIGTFRVMHRLIAFDGATGRVKRVVRTDRLGLRDPAGIDLHPDGLHYVVSGALDFLYVFRRGTHDLVRERCVYETLFGHSHLTVV